MTTKATSEAATARKTAATRVVEACHQTIDRTTSRFDEELSFIVADMGLLARAICAMAENPVCIGASAGVLLSGFQQPQVNDVLRLAQWIDLIAERTISDFDSELKAKRVE